ncbi:6-pyruvoyl tetrahydropterin synthase family protein [Phycicoccus sp.]|uniref:6-pyruvoyl trahydropterin synthase family protein n=1 Tax=Phycicoccus sp. TaxID=1902410 RepID=UPI00345EDD1A
MFRLTVRDRLMVAHSLPDPFFGPAQQLHGVTYVVEASFERPQLDEHNVVVDIGEAGTRLAEVLEPLNYRNLDDIPDLEGILTTTERMAQHIAEQLRERMDLTGLTALEVVLHEHPDAWAGFRLELT